MQVRGTVNYLSGGTSRRIALREEEEKGGGGGGALLAIETRKRVQEEVH